MTFTKDCGRNLNNKECIEFLRLVDAKAKLPRFKKNLSISKRDVIRQLHFLPYHRRWMEIFNEILKLNELKFYRSKEELDSRREIKKQLKDELACLWKKLDEQWSVTCDQLS